MIQRGNPQLSRAFLLLRNVPPTFFIYTEIMYSMHIISVGYYTCTLNVIKLLRLEKDFFPRNVVKIIVFVILKIVFLKIIVIYLNKAVCLSVFVSVCVSPSRFSKIMFDPVQTPQDHPTTPPWPPTTSLTPLAPLDPLSQKSYLIKLFIHYRSPRMKERSDWNSSC